MSIYIYISGPTIVKHETHIARKDPIIPSLGHLLPCKERLFQPKLWDLHQKSHCKQLSIDPRNRSACQAPLSQSLELLFLCEATDTKGKPTTDVLTKSLPLGPKSLPLGRSSGPIIICPTPCQSPVFGAAIYLMTAFHRKHPPRILNHFTVQRLDVDVSHPIPNRRKRPRSVRSAKRPVGGASDAIARRLEAIATSNKKAFVY